MKTRALYFGVILLLWTHACKTSDVKLPEDYTFTDEELNIAEANNRFTINLFEEIANDNTSENIISSPFSANMVLSMTSNGAAGQTLDEIKKGLNLDGFSEEKINSFYKKSFLALTQSDPKTEVAIANSIWYKNSFSVENVFLKTSKDFYNAQVEALDFEAPDASDKINKWVSSKTKGKIEGIIDGNIPEDMRMYLINALYFKGSWVQEFDPNLTEEGPFTTVNEPMASHTVKYMRKNQEDIDYHKNDLGEFISLPYGQGDYRMLVALPDKSISLQKFIKKTTYEDWKNSLQSLRTQKINLWLPKFKVEFETSLIPALKNRGMQLPFTHQADFSKISTQEPLLIGEVKQKAFVEVNEEGTEAAAVTNVGIVTTSAPAITQVKVDRPFVFMIQDSKSGLILFKGAIYNPNE